MSLVAVGKNQFRYSVKTVKAKDDDGELEQLVTVQSNLPPVGRSLQARLPRGFFVSRRSVIDLIQEGQRMGWNPAQKGSTFFLDCEVVVSEPEEIERD